jgi:hypothetical protein
MSSDTFKGFLIGVSLMGLFLVIVVKVITDTNARELSRIRQEYFCSSKDGQILETLPGYVCVRKGDIFIPGI